MCAYNDSLAKVFLSNRTELLYQSFRQQFHLNSHPFSKRLIIVPSPAMKFWLMRQMADDSSLGVAAGIEIGFLDATMQKIFASIAKSKMDYVYEPSAMELALTIESCLHTLISTMSRQTPSQQKIWAPLLRYLAGSDQMAPISIKMINRLQALSAILTDLFQQYGLYGEKILQPWLKGQSVEWQAALWNQLEAHFALWNYPVRKIELFEIDEQWEASDVQIHLFGLSYLSTVHQRFFDKIAKQLPVNSYILSPCQQFWSDTLSEKDRINFMQHWHRKGASATQMAALEGLLSEGNPLLANLGKVCQEMSKQIEQGDSLIFENYALPAGVGAWTAYTELCSSEISAEPDSHPFSLLKALQADVTLLRNPQNSTKIVFDEYDESIQVHAAPKPLREVEAIYDAVLKIMDRHAADQEPILASDILIMTPKLSEYAPFIRCVFEGAESSLQVQIMDLAMAANDPLIKNYLHLLQLADIRWQVSSLFTLFDCPAFQKKHGFKPNDIADLRVWVHAAKINWGKDKDHRVQLLEQEHCDKNLHSLEMKGTWDHGFNCLIEGMAFDQQDFLEEDSLFSPISYVESRQGELFGKFVSLIQHLKVDLAVLSSRQYLTVADWINYFKCLCESYFSCDGEYADSYSLLLEHFSQLERAGTKIKDRVFPFSSIKKHLEKALTASSSSYREGNLEAVRFCSLLPMRAVPAKVIVLMGLTEGDFPRIDKKLSLDLLRDEVDREYFPLQVDLDRCVFLEAILSARQYFILSYCNQRSGENRQLLPSLLITELLAYLDQSFEIAANKPSSVCFIQHALSGYDYKYFLGNGKFRSYSAARYAASALWHQTEKRAMHSFISAHRSSQDLPLTPGTLLLNLSELSAFAKYPHKTYLNRNFGIYVNEPQKRDTKVHDNFLLSPLESSIWLKQTIKTANRTALQPYLPVGPFKQNEKLRMDHEASLLHENLCQHINSQEVFSIEFSDLHQQAYLEGNNWCLPALKVHMDNQAIVSLSGKLDMVCASGLIIMADDAVEEAIKAWPTMLTFCLLVKVYALPIVAKIVFAKPKKVVVKNLDFDDVEMLLRQFLVYYLNNKTSLSLLLPGWIPHILAGDALGLQKEIDNISEGEFKPVYDQYLKWLKQSSPSLDAQSIIDHSQSTAKVLFNDMHDLLYPKKARKKVGETDNALV